MAQKRPDYVWNLSDFKLLESCRADAYTTLVAEAGGPGEGGEDPYVNQEVREDRAHFIWRRVKAENSLYYFGAEIIGLKHARDPKNGRYRLDPVLHSRMANELQDDEDTLQLYPRLHLKSTWVKIWCIWRIIKNQNIRIGMWSRTTKLVRKELKHIKQMCQKPELIELWPEVFAPRSEWQVDTQDEFTMHRDTSLSEPPQEGQLEVWGVGSTVVGHHYDYHVYDDIINEQSVTTIDQIDKVLNWWQMMQAIKELTATEKVIGTRYHHNDIYGTILHEQLFDVKKVTILPALIAGRPLYTFFSIEDLQRLRKRMGEYNYNTQMLNNAIPASKRIFTPPYPIHRGNEVQPGERIWYMAVDPAATTSPTSDTTGIALGYLRNADKSRMYCDQAYSVKLGPAELVNHIVDRIVQYRPKRLGIELGLQQAVAPLLELRIKEMERNYGVILRPDMVEISTKLGQMSKAEKLNRILGAFIRLSRISFSISLKTLFRQMDMFNPYSEKNSDDIIDATNMLLQTVEHFSVGHWFGVQEEDRTGYNMTFESIMKEREIASRRHKWGHKVRSYAS